MSIKGIFSSISWRLMVPAVLLNIIGLLSIYSSSLSRSDFFSFKKQLLFVAISLAAAVIISLIDLRFLKANSYLIFTLYTISLVLLAGLLFFGTKARGVRGWYKLGSFSLDPEPFAAIILIFVLSKYFARRHVEIHMARAIIFSGIYAFLPLCLVLFQPDLGSSVCLVVVWLGMILFSGIKPAHLLALGLLFAICFGLAWGFWFKDYQKQRIIAFLNPHAFEKGVAWSANQSKIAIGNGGFLGRGVGRGSQTQYGFLSEPKTDFVFAAIAEEFGFAGVSVLFFLFGALFWQIIAIIFQAQSNFLRLFAFGFAFLLMSQIAINIGMCLGLFPVIGIPLPFVSYSGSSTLAFYLGLGMLMSLERHA